MPPLLLRCKVVFLGNSTVGKTTLITSFVKGQFLKNYSMTSGADLQVKVVPVPDTTTSVELYLFDVAGEAVFSSMVPDYLDNVNFLALVYDSSSRDSFEAIPKWFNTYQELHPDTMPPGLLISTKLELQLRKEVDSDEGAQLAASMGFEYFETSALEGMNVEYPFLYMAQQFSDQYETKANQLRGE